MTEKTFLDAEHVIREHFHLIDEALEDAVRQTARKIAAEMGAEPSHEQIEEVENAVLSRMRVWAGAKLGAV